MCRRSHVCAKNTVACGFFITGVFAILTVISSAIYTTPSNMSYTIANYTITDHEFKDVACWGDDDSTCYAGYGTFLYNDTENISHVCDIACVDGYVLDDVKNNMIRDYPIGKHGQLYYKNSDCRFNDVEEIEIDEFAFMITSISIACFGIMLLIIGYSIKLKCLSPEQIQPTVTDNSKPIQLQIISSA